MCGENKDCGCNEEATKPTSFTVGQAAIHAAQNREWFLLSDEEKRARNATALETITAAGDETPEADWHACLTVEGLRTTDHRRIAEGALAWRQLPLAIFAQFLNAGHGQAPIVGSITSIERDEATGRIMGEGIFDLTHEAGLQAARMCANQTLRWGSVDLEVLESQYVEIGNGGGDNLLDVLFGDEVASAGGESDWYDEVTNARIMGYTMVATPAFPQAVIAPKSKALDIPEPMGEAKVATTGLLASGAIPVEPPSAWFANPELTEATPLTVEADGRVFGHIALWGTCHIGYDGSCVVPPRSNADYAYFRTGTVKTAEGDNVRVGQLTFEGGHANATLGWQDTTAHYDNSTTPAADVAVGEDELGIWFAGALRSKLSVEQIREFRASAISGDWRNIGGGLEMVAALAVNVPGFPIVASAGKRDGKQVSLLAAAVKPKDPMMVMATEIATLRRAMAPLFPMASQALKDRVNASLESMGVVTVAATPSKPTIEELTARVNLGGKPNPGTNKDRRLQENKKNKDNKDNLKKPKKGVNPFPPKAK